MVKISRLAAILLVMALVLQAALLALPGDRVSAAADGSNVYVNAATGDDANDGLAPTLAGGHGPKQHIAEALSIVWTNGTVHVSAGTYHEHDLHLNASYDLVGAGAQTTIIDAGGEGRVLYVASIVGQVNNISGLTIQNGHYSYGSLPGNGAALLSGAGMPVGGGVYVSLGHIANFIDCTIKDNRADFMGGGLYNAGQVSLTRCTVSGNSAAVFGGGLANYVDLKGSAGSDGPVSDGTMSLTNCTVYGNRVGPRVMPPSTGEPMEANEAVSSVLLGGGIYNGGYIDLVNVTIANNSLPSSHIPSSHGAGFANFPLQCVNDNPTLVNTPIATFKNTIVANNIPDNGYSGMAELHSEGNNIDSQNTCGFDQPTDKVNTDPLLGPLQNNGGPTSTCAITTSSPAFNYGNNNGAPDTDQRGVARPQGAFVCIGSFEVELRHNGSVSAATGGGTGLVKFSVSTGGITNLASMPVTGCSGAAAPGIVFPYGIFSFNIVGIAPGATVPITITLPAPVPANFQYWKCDGTGGWTDVTSLVSCSPGSATLVLRITDGGLGDADHTANRRITDPGGPAFARPAEAPSSSAYIAPTQSAVSLPNVAVQSAKLSAVQVEPGAPVTITAMVSNTGAVNGAAKINVYVNGQEETSRAVTIGSGSTSPVTFTVSRDEPGTYTVFVGGVHAGSFVVDQFSSPNMILFISAALIFLAFVAGVFLIWRRQQGRG